MQALLSLIIQESDDCPAPVVRILHDHPPHRAAAESMQTQQQGTVSKVRDASGSGVGRSDNDQSSTWGGRVRKTVGPSRGCRDVVRREGVNAEAMPEAWLGGGNVAFMRSVEARGGDAERWLLHQRLQCFPVDRSTSEGRPAVPSWWRCVSFH